MKIFLFLTFIFLTESSVFSQAGTLDHSFGILGVAWEDFGYHEYMYDFALTSDTCIVAVGSAVEDTLRDFIVAKYKTDGSLDTSFSGDGFSVFSTGVETEVFNSLAITSDNKIVAAGHRYLYGKDIVVVRMLMDGNLDSTFANNGVFTMDIFGNDDELRSVAITADNNIIAGGSAEFYDQDFLIIKLDAYGNLVNEFDDDGVLTFDYDDKDEYIETISIQDDGKIIAAGATHDEDFPAYDFNILINRYDAAGDPDTSFGVGGTFVYGVVYFDEQNPAIALQADGKIVIGALRTVAGGVYYDFLTLRITSSGVLDSTFSDDGINIHDLGSNFDMCKGIAVQEDKKIVVAGSYENADDDDDFAMIRYNSDGTIDETFGDDGVVITDFAVGDNQYAYDIEIQPDGKILLGGDNVYYTRHFALARYYPCGPTNILIDTLVCNSFLSPLGNTYFESGTYIETLPTITGCDSIFTINLTIPELDTLVSVHADTLTYLSSATTYQWVNCDSGYTMIEGAIDSFYLPTITGNYAVIIADSICTDTSECEFVEIAGVNIQTSIQQIAVYPNPFSDELIFESPKNNITIILYDLSGNLIYSNNISQSSFRIPTSQIPAGVYLLKYFSDNDCGSKVLLKQ